MKKAVPIIFLALGMLKLMGQSTHTVLQDDPSFGALSNVYFTPYYLLDFPAFSPRLSEPLYFEGSAAIAWGFRAHANIKERFQVEMNYRKGVWEATTHNFELGGALIVRTRTRVKPMDVHVSERSINANTKQVETFHTQGNQMNYFGFRAGLLQYQSQFKDDYFSGYANSFGAYGGITFGVTRNLQIQLKDRRIRERADYNRFYVDVLLAGTRYVGESEIAESVSGVPFGWRFGYEQNHPLRGAFGTTVHIEMGYRPGLAGYYLGMGFTFISLRGKIAALN
ncbi:MAG: hypothetical protein LAT76_03440 [Schleiferiaceae bacterium]|nr:hypothetical protein [Schleiferiaceae bacterium]